MAALNVSVNDPIDMIIIGGGPAGLTAAIVIARSQHTAIVFDSGEYRNSGVTHFHLLPTWDSKSPEDFRTAARANTLDNYTTTSYVDAKIKEAKQIENGLFEVQDEAGNGWTGRTLVLATGIEDIFPPIDGYGDCWGKSIFHCLFCHGYEQRGSESSGVLAIDDIAKLHSAITLSRNAAQLTKRVTIYTNNNPSLAAKLVPAIGNKAPVEIDDRQIVRLEPTETGIGLIVHFADGKMKKEAFLAHKPKSRIRGPFADQLGLERMPDGDIKVFPPFGETSVTGCFAAGDNSSPFKTVPNAINSGANVCPGAASHVQAKMYGQKSLGEMLLDAQRVAKD